MSFFRAPECCSSPATAAAHGHIHSPGSSQMLTQKKEPKLPHTPPEPNPCGFPRAWGGMQWIPWDSKWIFPAATLGQVGVTFTVPFSSCCHLCTQADARFRISWGCWVELGWCLLSSIPLWQKPKKSSGIKMWLLQGGLLSPPCGWAWPERRNIFIFAAFSAWIENNNCRFVPRVLWEPCKGWTSKKIPPLASNDALKSCWILGSYL